MAASNQKRMRPHPLMAWAWWVLFLVVFSLLNFLTLPVSSITPGAIVGLAALGILAVGAIWIRRLMTAAPQLGRAVDALGRGDVAAAREWLDEADRTSSSSAVHMAIDLHRAEIAWAQGDLGAVQTLSDLAAARRTFGGRRLGIDIPPRALRALVRAARGDRDRARADIEAVRRHPRAIPLALARAELAQAILLAKETDRHALADQVSRHRTLFGELMPRERAVARLLHHVANGEPFGQAAPFGPTALGCGEIPSWRAWLIRVLPESVEWAPEAPSEKVAPMPDPVLAPASAKVANLGTPTVTAASPAPSRSATNPILRLAGWMLVILMCLAVWQFLQSGSQAEPAVVAPPPEEDGPFVTLTVVLVSLTWATFLGLFIAAGLKNARALASAIALLARGQTTDAERAFEKLSHSKQPIVRAQALLQLSALAERRADFSRALDLCDKGLTALPQRIRASVADSLFPDLLSQRAFLLTALDRTTEAEAELAALVAGYPWFYAMSMACFRARLLGALRRGDVSGAAALAAHRSPLLPIHARVEVLANAAIRAAAAPDAAGLKAFRTELELEQADAAWLEKCAPALVASVEKGGDGWAGRDSNPGPTD